MIYVITHIRINEELYNKPDYIILPVGNLYMPSKNEANINSMNPYINELTGLYCYGITVKMIILVYAITDVYL